MIPRRFCPYLLSKHSIARLNRFHSQTEAACLWYQVVIAPIYYQNTALFDTTGSTVKQRLPVCDTKLLVPLFIIKTQHCSTQQVPQSNRGCLSVIPRRYCPYLLSKHSIVRHNSFHSQTEAACLWYQDVFAPIYYQNTALLDSTGSQSNRGCLSVIPSCYCPYLLSKHSIVRHNRFHSQTKAACLWYQAVISPIYHQNTALFDTTGSTVKQRLPVCDTKTFLPLFIIKTQHCSTQQVPQSNRGCLSVIPSRYFPYLSSKHSIVRHNRFHSQTEAACLWYQAVISPIYHQNTALFNSTGSTVKQRLPACDTKLLLPLFIIKTQHCSTQQVPQSNRGCLSVIPRRFCPYLLSKHSIVWHNRFHSLTEGACLWYQDVFAPIYYQNTALFDSTGSTVKQRLPVCDTKPLFPIFIIKTQHCSTQQVPQSNRGCLPVIPSRYFPYLSSKHSIVQLNRFHSHQRLPACDTKLLLPLFIIKTQHCSTQQVPQSNRGCLSVIPRRFCPYLLSKHSIVWHNRFHSLTEGACLWYQDVFAPIYYQNTALFDSTGSTVKQRLPVCDTKPLLPLFIIKTQHCLTQQVPQSNRGCLSVIPRRYWPYLLPKHSIVRLNRLHSTTLTKMMVPTMAVVVLVMATVIAMGIMMKMLTMTTMVTNGGHFWLVQATWSITAAVRCVGVGAAHTDIYTYLHDVVGVETATDVVLMVSQSGCHLPQTFIGKKSVSITGLEGAHRLLTDRRITLSGWNRLTVRHNGEINMADTTKQWRPIECQDPAKTLATWNDWQGKVTASIWYVNAIKRIYFITRSYHFLNLV